jgi:hypothetical protein
MLGSALIVVAASKEEVIERLKNDIYTKSGVVSTIHSSLDTKTDCTDSGTLITLRSGPLSLLFAAVYQELCRNLDE